MKEIKKEEQITTPETVMSDVAKEPRLNHRNNSSISNGAIVGIAVGVLIVCVVCFFVGVQVGKSSNTNQIGPGNFNSQSNQQMGPPGMNGQFRGNSTNSSDDTSVQ